jgi:hypothetical protein
MQKWEYCAVVGLRKRHMMRNLVPYYPAIWYFTQTGIKVVDIKGKEQEEVGKAISWLGEEGWEAVGELPVSPSSDSERVFGILFKRPKP